MLSILYSEEACYTIFKESRSLDFLANTLKNSLHVPIKASCCDVITSVCQCRPKFQKKVLQHGLIPAITQLLEYDKLVNDLPHVLNCISATAKENKEIKKALMNVKVTPHLVKFTFSDNPVIQLAALQAIQILSRGNEKFVIQILEMRALPNIIQILSETKDETIKVAATGALFELARDSPKVQEGICVLVNGPRHLLSALSHAHDFNLQYYCLGIMWMTCRNEDRSLMWKGLGAEEQIDKFIISTNAQVRTGAIALESLWREQKEKREKKKNSPFRLMKYLLF